MKKIICSSTLMLLLLCSLPLIASCEEEMPITYTPEEPADLVIINGKIVTVDDNFSIAEAVAVQGDKIIAVGTDREIKPFIGENTRVLDLDGKTMLPGINDTHVHSTLFGSEKPPLVIDLTDPEIDTIADIISAVKSQAQTAEPGQWIIGMGLYLDAIEEYNEYPARYPTRWDLDLVSPDNPVCLTVGYFTFMPPVDLLNSRAMEIAGIDKDTPFPPIGEIVKDRDTGEPTGLFTGMPMDQIIKGVLPGYNLEDKKQAALAAQRELNALGITSITDGALGPGTRGSYQGIWDDECIRTYEQLYNEGKLTIRVSILEVFTPYNAMDIERIRDGLAAADMHSSFDNVWLRIAGTKFFADGNPMMQTAWNYDPYPDDSYGTLNTPGETDEERIQSLAGIIAYAHDLGIQVGIHAIGDRAADVCAESFIEAERDNPKGLRHYIIHGSSVSSKNAKSMAEFDIGISTQPGMMIELMQFFGGMPGMLGGGGGGSMPLSLQEMIDHGVHIAGGSDVPCAGPNWKSGILGAMFQGCSIEQAIRMYTIEGAWQDHMEHIKGSIEVGKLADFCILDKDITKLDSEEIGDITNLMTIVGGEIVYDAGLLN